MAIALDPKQIVLNDELLLSSWSRRRSLSGCLWRR